AGFFGVFIAILVTAPLIPRTFEAGEVDLLLSKPIARPLLFLTKFLGGCTFILLNAGYFIAGLWLIVGIQFEIWNSRLLLCIPVFMFVFSVYYAVSAYAGLVWKNAIVSIILTLIFWAGCFAVGLSKEVVDSLLNPQRIARITPTGESLLITTKPGKTMEWQAEGRKWESVFDDKEANQPGPMNFGFRYPLIGPVYDGRNGRIVCIKIPGFGFQRFNARGTLAIGRRADDWRAMAGIPTPSGTGFLFIDPLGEIVTAGPLGIYRMEGEPSVEKRPFLIAGFDLAKLATPETQPLFVKVQPDEQVNWNQAKHFDAVMRPSDGQLAVYHDSQITQLKLDDKRRYVTQHTNPLPTEEAALLGYTNKHLITALESGEILLANLKPFKVTARFRPFKKNKPKHISTSRDGRWVAVLFHHRHLWLYDFQSSSVSRGLTGQGDISATTFTANQTLMTSTGFGEVHEYSLPSLTRTASFAPKPETLELVYRYAIRPLYNVFPKPGQLDNLVSYLLTNEESVEIDSGNSSLQSERVVLDVWSPIWTNLCFVGFMLTISCLRVWRRDF
ncbi:MAG: ABC transporter permease, partial [Planctomycetaceae bacterium]